MPPGRWPAPAASNAAAIVARFPAEDGATRNALAAQLLKLGEPGLTAVTSMLTPPETGGDTPARWALNAVAVYASRAGAETQRALTERAFVAAFTSATDVEVRTFLLRQLRTVGREAAVKAAAPFLVDPDLSEPATQLMLQVRGLSARTAIAAAFAKAPPDKPAIQATLAKAAGEMKAAEAHDALVTLTKAADPGLRRPAFNALARLGSVRCVRRVCRRRENGRLPLRPGEYDGRRARVREAARRAGPGGLVAEAVPRRDGRDRRR